MKTIIIYVNFKTQKLIIKLIVNIGSPCHFKTFICQETILETIDLTRVDLMDEPIPSLYQQYTCAMATHQDRQLTQPLVSLYAVDVKHIIKKWIDRINTNECIIDLTDVSQYEFKHYRIFIKTNFSTFAMLHS